jgi:predicted HTH transcriptional regulator
VYINNNLLGGAYRRNAEGDYRCSEAEVKAMLRDQSEIPSDGLAIDELNWQDLDRESINRYRNCFKSLKPVHVWNTLETDEFLQKIGAAKKKEQSIKPTIAGLVMFGTEDVITQILPDYFLDYREKYDASRWTDRVVSNLGEWSGNIFDFFFKVVGKLTADIKTPFQMRNYIERLDDTAIHTALREALANTLIHADYYGRRGIVIEKTKTNILFANPGICRPGIKEALNGGVSDPRNPSLFKMFALIDIGERVGSGLFNIRTVWNASALPAPSFVCNYAPDRTTLSLEIELEYKKNDVTENLENVAENVRGNLYDVIENVTENLENVIENLDDVTENPGNVTEKQRKMLLLDILRSNPRMATGQLAERFSITRRTVQRDIDKLKAQGILERVGPDKGGYWNIIKGDVVSP